MAVYGVKTSILSFLVIIWNLWSRKKFACFVEPTSVLSGDAALGLLIIRSYYYVHECKWWIWDIFVMSLCKRKRKDQTVNHDRKLVFFSSTFWPSAVTRVHFAENNSTLSHMYKHADEHERSRPPISVWGSLFTTFTSATTFSASEFNHKNTQMSF